MNGKPFVTYKTIKCNGNWKCVCDDKDKCTAVVSDFNFNADNFYGKSNNLKGLLTRYEPIDERQHQEFHLFPSYSKFNEYLSTLEEKKRCYHEVIIGNSPQKVKIDIDIDDKISPEILNSVQIDLPKLARDIFFNMYYDQLAELAIIHGLDLSDPYFVDTCITYSKSKAITLDNIDSRDGCIFMNKAGLHIIIKKFMVANNLDAKEFTRRFLNALPLEYKRDSSIFYHAIDDQINKNIQSLRLIGCHKPHQDNRVKNLVASDGKDRYIDSVITQGGEYTLKPLTVIKYNNTESKELNTSELTSFESIIKEACDRKIPDNEKEAHEFRNIVSKLNDKDTLIVNYDRVLSSHCDICNKMHDNDNTMIFYINNIGAFKDIKKITWSNIRVNRSCRKKYYK